MQASPCIPKDITFHEIKKRKGHNFSPSEAGNVIALEPWFKGIYQSTSNKKIRTI
jgi:hypothetical protein